MSLEINQYYNYITAIAYSNAKSYKQILEEFNERLHKEYGEDMSVEKLKLHHITEYIQYFRGKKMKRGARIGQTPAESYVKCVLKIIKQFLKFLKRNEYNVIPREQVPSIKNPESRFDMVSEENYNAIRNIPEVLEKEVIVARRNQLIIDILHDTGLRRAEVLRLTFDDFKTKNRQFEVKIKGGRIGSCFYSEKLRKKVLAFERLQNTYLKEKKIKNENNLILISYGRRNTGGKLNLNYISCMFNHYTEFLKKSETLGLKERVHAHQFRHAFATRCVISGLSQQATCALMRHVDPATTLRYYHLNDTFLRSQYDRIKQ